MICGESGTGKTMSLKPLANDEGVCYANCEAGKDLPFKYKLRQVVITDPMDIYALIEEAENKPFHTIVIDTLTFLMDMYETQYVLRASNQMKAWGDYAQFFKTLMQEYVARSSKNIIFLAHTARVFNESEGTLQTRVPIKGALKDISIEAWFSVVLAAKKRTLKELEGLKSPYLNITPREERLGFKHVIQTDVTKDNITERLRSPDGMWGDNELYIDNNIGFVLDKLNDYYD